MIYTCDDIRRIGINVSCCPGCHSEYEESYLEECFEEDNGDELWVCCSIADEISNWSMRDIWKKLRELEV